MYEILFPVLIVAGIGLIAGLGLAIASAVMAVPKDEKAEKITEMLPVSMFSMSPAILSILMISQPTIPMIFQNITNLLILTRIPLPYRVPSQIRKNTSPD